MLRGWVEGSIAARRCVGVSSVKQLTSNPRMVITVMAVAVALAVEAGGDVS